MEHVLLKLPEPRSKSAEALALWFVSLPPDVREMLIDSLSDAHHRWILDQFYGEGTSPQDLAVRMGCDPAFVMGILRRFHLLAAETIREYLDQRVLR